MKLKVTLVIFGVLILLYAKAIAGNQLLDPEFWKKATVKDVKQAVSKGADVNVKDRNGWTPLHWAAAFNQNPEVITTLVELGAEINAKDKDDRTALHRAVVWNPNPEVITTLVKLGANVNARDRNGWAPLHRAVVWNPNPEVITILVKFGANVNARNKDGRTPLHVALFENLNTELIELITTNKITKLEKFRQKYPQYEDMSDEDLAQRLYLKYYSDIPFEQYVQKIGLSLPPNSSAKQRSISEKLALLIKFGAEINARDKDGVTSLHRAAGFNQNPEVITTLVKLGAEINARDKTGLTPLHAAAKYTKKPEVILTLIKLGANPKARALNGKLPLDLAKENSNIYGTKAFWRLNDLSY